MANYGRYHVDAIPVLTHALQLSLPDKVKIWQIDEHWFVSADERYWVVHGLANGKAFTIDLKRPHGEPFPFEEALQKLRVFA